MAEDQKAGILSSIKSMFTQKATMGAKESARPEEVSAEPEQKGGVEQIDFDVIKASFTNIESSLEKMNTVFTDIHETLQQLFAKTTEDEYKKEEQASEQGAGKPVPEKKVAVKEDGPGFFDSLKELFMNPAVIAALAGIVYTVLPKETQEKIKAVLGGFASGLEETTGGISGLSTGVKAVGIALATFFTAKFIKSIGDALTTVVNMVKSVGRMGKFGKMALVGTALVVGGKMLADKFGEDDEKEDDEDEKVVAKAEKEDKGEEKPAVEEKKPDIAATATKEPEKEPATGGGKTAEGGSAAGAMVPGAGPAETPSPAAGGGKTAEGGSAAGAMVPGAGPAETPSPAAGATPTAQAEQRPSPADSGPKGFMEQVQERQVPKREEAPAAAPAPTPSATTPSPAPAAAAKPAMKEPSGVPATKPTPVSEAPTKQKEAAVSTPKVSGMDDVKSMIKKHEGVRTKPYKDSLGLWTVGVGHLIGDGKSLPREWDREFSMKEVDDLFEGDFAHHVKIAEQTPGYSKANQGGKAAFIDLAFNMGKWWPKWPSTKKKLEDGDFQGAAQGLQESRWYTQVGNRAKTIVALVQQAGGAESKSELTPQQQAQKVVSPTQSITPAPSPKAETGTQIAEMSTKNEAMASQRPTAPIVNTSSQTNNMSGGGAQKTDSQNVQTPIPIANRGSLKTATKHSTQYV